MYIFIVLALVIPALNIWSPLPAKSKGQNTSAYVKIVNISVIESPLNEPSVSVSTTETAALNDCLVNSVAKNAFLQGASYLNLNQPANCFSLKINQVFEPSQKIFFALPRTYPLVTVLTKNAFFERENLVSNHPKNNTATETLVVLGLLIAFYPLKKIIKSAKSVKPQIVFFQRTTFDLLVLRC